MQNKLAAFSSDYQEIVLKKLYRVFDKAIKQEIDGFVELETKIHKAYQEKINDPKVLISTKKQVLEYTSGYWSEPNPKPIASFAEEFLQSILVAIDKFPQQYTRRQRPERFQLQDEDSFFLRFLKSFKILFWGISQAPKWLLRKNLTYWKHQVPVRDVMFVHLVQQVHKDVLHLMVPHYKTLMQAYLDMYRWESSDHSDKKYNQLTEVVTKLKKLSVENKRQLKQQLKDHAGNALEKMHLSIDKVGTIELSSGKFRRPNSEKTIDEMEELWLESETGWSNTFDVFLESWRSKLSIQILILKVKADIEQFLQGQSENIDEYVGKELDEIDKFLTEARSEIEKTGDSLPSTLKQILYKAKKSLDQTIIPSLLEKIGNKNMVNGIARLEASILHSLEELSAERRMPKVNTDFLQPLDVDEIATISLRDLITFEAAPAVREKLGENKEKLVTRLGENLQAAQDIDHMIMYGLAASLDEFSTHEDLSAATAVALSSLDRSAARVKDIRESLKHSVQQANDGITQASQQYITVLEGLTETENIRELRLRLIKAKTLKSTDEYKNVVVHWLGLTYHNIRGKVRTSISSLVGFANKLIKRFNLNADDEVNLEVSNFLIESADIFDSLPFIYRNLFQITPVTDQELFVGRKKELQQLTEAYNQWVDNKKGAVAIVGEKWSGLTSLVNNVQDGDFIKYQGNRFKTRSSPNIKQEIYSFFGKILDQEINDNTSWIEIADFFNSGSRKVIIIEDVHCMYLRQVGGFEVLMSLADLIQMTSHRVFWIVTCNLYVWQYLQRTLQFDEFFRYHIELQPPTAEEIEQLIIKRNRISGYKPYFTYSEDFANSKKFRKASPDEQQIILKEKFYKDLIKYASSNISMALMFYLLSTKEIKDDQILIGEFKRPDFAFLSALPMDKITTLHLLILHDGLTLGQYNKLARIPDQTGKLLIGSMYEDGILQKREGVFVVNPLIYKSVISLLKAKNLL